MIRTGLVGLGKMGISHCAIINAQPDVKLVAVCEPSSFVSAAIKKYAPFSCFKDYEKMIDESNLDAVVIATPTKFHFPMVRYALNKGLHVFVEKPFCLNVTEGRELVRLAAEKGVVNQVGYHNRFIGIFCEAKRLISKGVLGEVYHILGEAYGPVVLKEKTGSWRGEKSEGGGCLYDYASHVINLMNFTVGMPKSVAGTVLKSIYSAGVDDAVYSTFYYDRNLTGQLSVNWSDESYRKMSTIITVEGKKGKLISDAQECKIFMREPNAGEGLEKGWNMRYITDVTENVGFYLRGEEYSAQIEYFFKNIASGSLENVNSFASALETDEVVDMLIRDKARC